MEHRLSDLFQRVLLDRVPRRGHCAVDDANIVGIQGVDDTFGLGGDLQRTLGVFDDWLILKDIASKDNVAMHGGRSVDHSRDNKESLPVLTPNGCCRRDWDRNVVRKHLSLDELGRVRAYFDVQNMWLSRVIGVLECVWV